MEFSTQYTAYKTVGTWRNVDVYSSMWAASQGELITDSLLIIIMLLGLILVKRK